jgi:Flp pilus assembly protein TadG
VNRRGKGAIRRNGRRGAAVVEFAIVVPLFLLLVFSMFEFGRVIMVQQVLTNAAREGARRAILEDATPDEIEFLVENYLARSSVPGASVSVTPVPLTGVAFSEPVTVTVTVPMDQVGWIATPWFTRGILLSATAVMRAERPQ